MIPTVTIIRAISNKNSFYICFAYSSVTDVHKFANDILSPSDPLLKIPELSSYVWPCTGYSLLLLLFIGAGAGGGATTLFAAVY